VIDPLGYRDRFPILADCTYLINHSLAAMPAAPGRAPWGQKAGGTCP